MAKGSSGTGLLKGLKTRSPSVDDASRKLPTSPSVDKDATRSKPSPATGTIGPRTA